MVTNSYLVQRSVAVVLLPCFHGNHTAPNSAILKQVAQF